MASGEVAPHTLLRLMNWLDQRGALDQLSATISEAVENWLDLQQAQNDDKSSTLAYFAAPTATSASPPPLSIFPIAVVRPVA